MLKPAAFVASLVPLVSLLWDVFTGGLGANPVEAVTHRTGFAAITLLMITLAVTPVRQLTGLAALVNLRRMFGLFAFFYASLHFAWYWLDQTWFAGLGLSLEAVLEDIAKRPYITVGFAAFVMLVPLAVTSTNRMLKRLGAARWKALHRLVYFAAAGAVLHYLWRGKVEDVWGVGYGIVLVGFLSWRLVYWRLQKGLRSRPKVSPAAAERSPVPAASLSEAETQQ